MKSPTLARIAVSGLLAFAITTTFLTPAAAERPSREREAFATDYLTGRFAGLGHFELQVLMWHEYREPGWDDTGHIGVNIRIQKTSSGFVLLCWFGEDVFADFDGIRSASGTVESTGADGRGDCRVRDDAPWTSVPFRAHLSATIEGTGDRFQNRAADR